VARFSLANDSTTTFVFYSVLFSIFVQSFAFYLLQVAFKIFGENEPFTNLRVLVGESIILFLACQAGRVNTDSFTITKTFKEISFRPLDFTTFLISFSLPICSLTAVQTLNRNQSAKLTAAFISASIAFIYFIYKKWELLGQLSSLVLLYSITLSLILSSYFRGDGGFWGYDINGEFAVANQTLNLHSISSLHDNAYGTMLSITVLPVVFSYISKLSLVIIFKIFYALLLAFIPIVILEMVTRFVPLGTGILIVTAMIIGSISFLPQLPALNRQTVGFLFFLGILSEIFGKKRKQGKLFFFVGIFSLGMAFSHYSVSYIASLIFAIAAIFKFFLSRRRSLREGSRGNLSLAIAAVILINTVLWNGVVNSNLTQFQTIGNTATQKGLNLLPHSSQGLVQRWLTATVRQSPNPEQIKINELDYLHYKNPRAQLLKSGSDQTLVPASYETSIYLLGVRFGILLSWLFIFSTLLLQLYVFLALLFLSSRIVRWKRVEVGVYAPPDHRIDALVLGFAAFVIGLIVRISGTFANFYNPERFGSQLYFIFAIVFAIYLRDFLHDRQVIFQIVSSSLIIIGCLQTLFASGVSGYFTGNLSARISNAKDIDQGFIISNEERYLASTLYFLLPEGKKIVVDNRGRFPFDQVNIAMKLRLKVGANPYLWEKGDYIYISRANIVTGISNNSFPIKTPIKYLESNFDRVYVSDNTRVYR
jgi:hypothetical protein